MRRATDVKQYHMSVNSNKAEGTFLSTFVGASCCWLQPHLSCLTLEVVGLVCGIKLPPRKHFQSYGNTVHWSQLKERGGKMLLWIYCGLKSEKNLYVLKRKVPLQVTESSFCAWQGQTGVCASRLWYRGIILRAKEELWFICLLLQRLLWQWGQNMLTQKALFVP